jgi:hypothetical protein
MSQQSWFSLVSGMDIILVTLTGEHMDKYRLTFLCFEFDCIDSRGSGDNYVRKLEITGVRVWLV